MRKPPSTELSNSVNTYAPILPFSLITWPPKHIWADVKSESFRYLKMVSSQKEGQVPHTHICLQLTPHTHIHEHTCQHLTAQLHKNFNYLFVCGLRGKFNVNLVSFS